jgi:hypothetical protein
MSKATASACAAARVAGAEPAESPARGHRAHEHVAVRGVGGDPRAVAEQRSARSLRRWVDGQHRHAAAVAAPSADEL